MRSVRRFSRLSVCLVLALSTLLWPAAPTQAARKSSKFLNRQPMLVTLNFHHSTQGILGNAFPILDSAGIPATLALVVHELERTSITPTEVSQLDQPFGYGNVQPISVEPVGADGLYTSRHFAALPGSYIDDDGIRMLAGAGWELAHHGADHTTQPNILAQVDGTGKLQRAYAAGIREIRRLLGDPQYEVRTNTLPSNHWVPELVPIADATFDWTEVTWWTSQTHVPVAYSLTQDPQARYNSAAFNRTAHTDIFEVLDSYLRFAGTDGGGWLILQLHDVVQDLADSPHSPTALLLGEFQYLMDGLRNLGVQFVTFSEGATVIQRQNRANRLRNTRFGQVFRSWGPTVTEWGHYIDPEVAGASLSYQADGSIVLISDQEPAYLSVGQVLSPGTLEAGTFVLQLDADLSGLTGGHLSVEMEGPLGTLDFYLDPARQSFCAEIDIADLTTRPDIETVKLQVRAWDIEGTASLSGFSLEALRGRRNDCSHNR